MRAATIPASTVVEVGEAELRAAAADEAIVAVTACGICGSNLHEWRQPEAAITSEVLPGAAGHELVGTVVEAAADGTGPVPGTRVTVEPNRVRGCARCESCTQGSAWFCSEPRAVAGWGFAERMVAPTAALFPVPVGIGDLAATLVEPMACAIHALRTTYRAASRGIDGATVAVIGAGVTGLLTIAAARHLGAAHVVSVARHPHQAAAAWSLGADDVLPARDDDVRQQLKRRAPAVVVEAVGGTAATLDLALASVSVGGEVAVLGLFDAAQTVDVRRAMFRELRLSFPVTYGVLDGLHDFTMAIEVLAAGGDMFDQLITHRFPLPEIHDAFGTAADKSAGSLRVVVMP